MFFATSSKQKKAESISQYTKTVTNVQELFKTTKIFQDNIKGDVLQSSGSSTSSDHKTEFFAPGYTNSFVGTVIKAYNDHHNLVLRPDDVWIAIQVQFSFYLNKYAEQLRSKFVRHEGQKELVVNMGGTMRHGDYGLFTQRMVETIDSHLVDDQVKDWMMSCFSTTEPVDKIVAAVLVMSSMQQYFKYTCCFECGIPSVKLLGTVDDWKLLRTKVERLIHYDVQGHMTWWRDQLLPIMDEFILSVQGKPNLDFWDKIALGMVAVRDRRMSVDG